MIFSFYSMIQTIPRSHAMSLLPVIVDAKAEVYIKTTEEEAISWHAYINPFSNEMWFMLFIVAIVLSFGFTIVEKIFCSEEKGFILLHYSKNLWIALKSNVGGKPNNILKYATYQILLFTCLLVGSVVWMAYRASFTSELSVRRLKYPFNDLESLLKSDYK